MTKSKAIQAISNLSSGTIAGIIGSAKYSLIDDAVNTWILKAAKLEESAFKRCETWMDVLALVK